MFNDFRGVGLPILGITMVLWQAYANDYFVAPNGTAVGPGTVAAPYDLTTALSGQVSQPGDTFWLRGGNYNLGHLNTMIAGAPDQPVTFRPVSGENARVDGSISLFNSAGYLVFRDFELYGSDTNRVSSQTGVGFDVTDIRILPGFGCYVPNVSFINLIIHDQTRHGIYTSQQASNTLIFGCILYNNGWVSPDNAEGHGLYVQGDIGTRTIAENIVFNNSGASMHIYENDPGEGLVGVNLFGNVAFGAGAIQTVRDYRDWIVGVDFPAQYADGITLQDNMGFLTPGSTVRPEVQIGRGLTNGSVVLVNNYMPLGLQVSNWSNACVTGNLFAASGTNYVVNLDQTLTSLTGIWNSNTYLAPPMSAGFLLNLDPYTASEWQAATGFDKDTKFATNNLTGTKVFIRTNPYEMGRANITVYNWDGADNVTVDVSHILTMGWSFEVRNAQDFLAGPVLSGIYSGQPLELPMTNLSVALPNGPLVAPPPTGTTFNVFVLLSKWEPLRVWPADGSLLLRWPISLGPDALQWTENLSIPKWMKSTIIPAMVGDQFTVIEPLSEAQRFFACDRLGSLPSPDLELAFNL